MPSNSVMLERGKTFLRLISTNQKEKKKKYSDVSVNYPSLLKKFVPLNYASHGYISAPSQLHRSGALSSRYNASIFTKCRSTMSQFSTGRGAKHRNKIRHLVNFHNKTVYLKIH